MVACFTWSLHGRDFLVDLKEGQRARNMWSYDRHKNHEMRLVQDEEFPSCYTGPDTIDAWRHLRFLECTLPLLTEWPVSEWITIGDGNFGSDAFFLRSHGVAVTATSISSNTLSIAHANGWIDAYAAENAESLSYEDNAVDFVQGCPPPFSPASDRVLRDASGRPQSYRVGRAPGSRVARPLKPKDLRQVGAAWQF